MPGIHAQVGLVARGFEMAECASQPAGERVLSKTEADRLAGDPVRAGDRLTLGRKSIAKLLL